MSLDASSMAAIRADLSRDEGRVAHAYQDHLGYWTIGVGFMIDKRRGGGLRDEEIDFILNNRIRLIANELESLPAWNAVKSDPVRARALINMAFQMGTEGVRKFTTSLSMIARKDWAGAGRNLRRSLWYQQTPARAERVIRMIETGRAA